LFLKTFLLKGTLANFPKEFGRLKRAWGRKNFPPLGRKEFGDFTPGGGFGIKLGWPKNFFKKTLRFGILQQGFHFGNSSPKQFRAFYIKGGQRGVFKGGKLFQFWRLFLPGWFSAKGVQTPEKFFSFDPLGVFKKLGDTKVHTFKRGQFWGDNPL